MTNGPQTLPIDSVPLNSDDLTSPDCVALGDDWTLVIDRPTRDV